MGVIGGLGLLVLALVLSRAVPAAARGDLARNGGLGIRTRATQASDAAWVAGHAAAAPIVRPTSIGAAVVGVLLIVLGVVAPGSVAVVVLWVLGYAGVAAGLLAATIAADRAARAA